MIGRCEVIEEARDVGVLTVQNVLIAQGGRGAVVTHAGHERSERSAAGGECGSRVPQLVEAQRLEAGRLERGEPYAPTKVASSQWAARGLAEHEAIGILVGIAEEVRSQ